MCFTLTYFVLTLLLFKYLFYIVIEHNTSTFLFQVNAILYLKKKNNFFEIEYCLYKLYQIESKVPKFSQNIYHIGIFKRIFSDLLTIAMISYESC